MNADTVGWESYVKTWMVKNCGHWPEGGADHVWMLFANNVAEGLKFIRKNSFEPIPTNDIALIDSLCSLLDSLTHEDTCPRLKDEPAHFTKLLDKLFLYSYIWTIGGAMDNKSMLKFDSFCTN
jgi:dynein heavy chain